MERVKSPTEAKHDEIGTGENREWKPIPIKEREGVYIGYRVLTDVYAETYPFDSNSYYKNIRNATVALIVFNERKAPQYVPFESLEIIA